MEANIYKPYLMRDIYGGGSPSPHRAKPAGSPLPPLGLTASRLALCARSPLKAPLCSSSMERH